MSAKDLVTKEILQDLTSKVQDVMNNYCWNLEYFTPSEVESLFDGTTGDIKYYSSLIKDDVVSKNFLFSSKKVSDEIAKAILEANNYANELITNIATVSLEYVDVLPSTGQNNVIYISPVINDDSSITYTIYVWKSSSSSFVQVGTTKINMTNYYTMTQTDNLLNNKAEKSEVILNDKLVQTLGTVSADTVISTIGIKAEMDKKANDDEVIKKTSLVTSIDSSSTDSEVPSALATFNLLKTVYPVGSIYINTTDVNPSTIFGFGTWKRVAQNMTLWGSSADGEAGTTKSAGLPNITGQIGTCVPTGHTQYASGAFSAISMGAIGNSTNGGTDRNVYGFAINASKSSPIYGNSTTVQPPALVVNIWKRTA